jgi:glycosyltransferase involved in cell wall biosynthesis
MKLPNVTVIVCHKDYQQYLGDAIQSARNQTYPNVRICIIDGGSKDFDSVLAVASKTLFDKFEKHDVGEGAFIYSDGKNALIQIKTNGPSMARNKGIELYFKDTDYFMILDADDMMDPNKIRVMVDAVLFSPVPQAVGAVYGDCIIRNTETGQETKEYREPYSIQRLQQECIVHSNSLISKLALQRVGLYDETLRVAEDYDLWLRIAKEFAILHVPEFLSIVRVQPQNSTATVPKHIWEDCLRRIREKHG